MYHRASASTVSWSVSSTAARRGGTFHESKREVVLSLFANKIHAHVQMSYKAGKHKQKTGRLFLNSFWNVNSVKNNACMIFIHTHVV